MRLKDGAVPSKFCWTEKEKSANVDRQLRAERRQLQHDIIVDQDVDMVDESVIVIDSSIEMLHVEEVETVAEKTTTKAYKNNPRGIPFYTGIDNYVIFRDVFASLGPATTRFNYMSGVPNLDSEDQFF